MELFSALDASVMYIRTHDYWKHAIAHSSLVCNLLTLFTLKYLKIDTTLNINTRTESLHSFY